MSSTQAIQSRLRALRSNLEELMKIGSTPGTAIAVIHNGELIYQENLGYRDLDNKLPVTAETIFPCASLTKAVVAAGLGICVDEEIGDLKWDSKVHDVLPEWTSADEILRKEMTVTDCLSHRAGMEAPDHWLGTNNNILIPQEKSLEFLNALQRPFPFRASYGYNNCGYEIAGHILTKAASQRWDTFLKTRIFDPLNMTRTSTHAAPPSDPNFATGYWALDAYPNNPARIVPITCSGETFMGAAGAMHSCTADLVKLYTAFLDSAADQYANSYTSTSGSPLKQVPTLFCPQVNMNPTLLREQSYALGWARLQTPGPMDQLRPQKNRPDVGKGVPSELVLYHQGSFPGALAFVALVPRLKGCVLVLTNGLSMSVNPADLMGQALLEGYLGVGEGDKNDYVELVRREKEEKDGSWFEDIKTWLDENRTGGDCPRELEDYVGDYWDEAKTLMPER
ncbi:Beta-lactamase transpeptidase protein [Rutstroemia sp. NJR-2017a BBW]|nr:Beta-lactamase transpeptidase protein [Rutstroemia sp. NJR-2017a BBW]